MNTLLEALRELNISEDLLTGRQRKNIIKSLKNILSNKEVWIFKTKFNWQGDTVTEVTPQKVLIDFELDSDDIIKIKNVKENTSISLYSFISKLKRYNDALFWKLSSVGNPSKYYNKFLTEDKTLLEILQEFEDLKGKLETSSHPKRDFNNYFIDKYNIPTLEGDSGINLKAKPDKEAEIEYDDLQDYLEANIKSIKGMIPENMVSYFCKLYGDEPIKNHYVAIKPSRGNPDGIWGPAFYINFGPKIAEIPFPEIRNKVNADGNIADRDQHRMNNTRFVVDLLNNGFSFGPNPLYKKSKDIIHATNKVDNNDLIPDKIKVK